MVRIPLSPPSSLMQIKESARRMPEHRPVAMNWFYKRLIRPSLFARDSEQIHDHTLAALGWVSRHEVLCEALASFFETPDLPMQCLGLSFPNPVGLAAGMDKHAGAVPAWAALGFGFSELGGVTWHGQPGNPPPRVFRAVADQALVNRMGFNNAGAGAMAAALDAWRASGRWPKHPVGINLGKSKVTPLEKAAGDYANSLRALWSVADFFVINVSSPNTPNLRQLQDKAALNEILAAVQETNSKCAREAAQSSPRAQGFQATPDLRRRAGSSVSTHSLKPILVKVAPDLSFEALDEIVELTSPRRIAGLVATNTTITRPQTADPMLQRVYAEMGGLSGCPLRGRSTEVIRHLYRQTEGRIPILGVGGIFNAADAWEKITAGASLIQIYTGLIYEGPWIVRDVVRGLRERLRENGLEHLREAVGLSHRVRLCDGRDRSPAELAD